MHGTTDELHFSTAGGTFLGQGKAHLAAGVVADEADGVYALVGGAGGDEDALAGEILPGG